MHHLHKKITIGTKTRLHELNVCKINISHQHESVAFLEIKVNCMHRVLSVIKFNSVVTLIET